MASNSIAGPARQPVCVQCGSVGARWFQPLIGTEHFCSRACVQTWAASHYTDGSHRATCTAFAHSNDEANAKIHTTRGCAHAIRGGLSFASSSQDIARGFCSREAMPGSDFCVEHDRAHPVAGLNVSMQRALPADGSPAVVDRHGHVLSRPRNLGWLLRHATECDHVYVTPGRDGVRLTARMSGLEPGACYVTHFESAAVCWQWLDRPLFRGVALEWFGVDTRCGAASMPVVGPRPRRAQRAPMADGPLNQAEYAAWSAARTPAPPVEDHFYVVGGTYAEQPACAVCRRFRAEHHPSPVAGA